VGDRARDIVGYVPVEVELGGEIESALLPVTAGDLAAAGKLDEGAPPPLAGPADALPLDLTVAEPLRVLRPAELTDLDVVALTRRGEVRCSGVVVASGLVLTARHCTQVDTVVSGEQAHAPVVQARVRRVLTHPNLGVDAAVLVLDRTMAAEPRARWTVDGEVPPPGLYQALGYGARATDGAGRRHAIPLYASGWGCSASERFSMGCDPEWEMVVQSPDGADTCVGDSGGRSRGPPPGSNCDGIRRQVPERHARVPRRKAPTR
jgi:hypothetical protein